VSIKNSKPPTTMPRWKVFVLGPNDTKRRLVELYGKQGGAVHRWIAHGLKEGGSVEVVYEPEWVVGT